MNEVLNLSPQDWLSLFTHFALLSVLASHWQADHGVYGLVWCLVLHCPFVSPVTLSCW